MEKKNRKIWWRVKLEEYEARIIELEDKVKKLESLLEEKDAMIQSLSSKTDLSNYVPKNVYEESLSIISNLKEEILALNDEIERLKHEIDAKDQLIEALKKTPVRSVTARPVTPSIPRGVRRERELSEDEYRAKDHKDVTYGLAKLIKARRIGSREEEWSYD